MPLDEFLSQYTFDVDASIKDCTIKIDTSAGFGYFRGVSEGDDTWGVLTFKGNELVNFDETIIIPKKVIRALVRKKYRVAEELNNWIC
jgi:hypothetical protein